MRMMLFSFLLIMTSTQLVVGRPIRVPSRVTSRPDKGQGTGQEAKIDVEFKAKIENEIVEEEDFCNDDPLHCFRMKKEIHTAMTSQEKSDSEAITTYRQGCTEPDISACNDGTAVGVACEQHTYITENWNDLELTKDANGETQTPEQSAEERNSNTNKHMEDSANSKIVLEKHDEIIYSRNMIGESEKSIDQNRVKRNSKLENQTSFTLMEENENSNNNYNNNNKYNNKKNNNNNKDANVFPSGTTADPGWIPEPPGVTFMNTSYGLPIVIGSVVGLSIIVIYIKKKCKRKIQIDSYCGYEIGSENCKKSHTNSRRLSGFFYEPCRSPRWTQTNLNIEEEAGPGVLGSHSAETNSLEDISPQVEVIKRETYLSISEDYVPEIKIFPPPGK